MKTSKLYLLRTLVLVLFMILPAMAGKINFTGNVEDDFDPTDPNTIIIEDPGNPGGSPGEIMAGPNVSGWDIKDLRLHYDSDEDIMYVGINSWGIVGDVDGNGSPDTTNSPEYHEESDLCGAESVAVYFDLDFNEPFDNETSWDLIAGIREGFCYDYSVVAEWDTWIGYFYPPGNFGAPLIVHFDPSADPCCPSFTWPDYEIVILNWSMVPSTLGIDADPNKFRVGAFMGSSDDGAIGEDTIFYQHNPVPEPDFTLEKISGDDQSGEPGATLPEPFVVRVVDQNGDPIEGVPVTFSVIAGGGSVDVGNTTTDADGLAESTLTLGPNPGINTVEVTAEGIITTVTFEATAVVVLNLPPVATDDFVTTTMGTSVDFNILENDYDSDGDPLVITHIGNPTNGTLIPNYVDGQCEYTPDEGFIGTDSFEYEISDGSLSATATVTLTVNDPSTPAEQIEEIINFIEDSVVSGMLTGNGPGASGKYRLNAFVNILEEAANLIEEEQYDEACDQLRSAYRKCDGQSEPPDFVKGEASYFLANMILIMMDELGCE
jgi:hypothetical protein